MEKRQFGVAIELREVNGKPVIAGYAAVFEQLSVVLWGFREKVAHGAFADSLEDDVRALWNHNPDYPLGRRKNGTLRLAEDKTGLSFELDVPETQQGRDVVELVRAGYVDGMSFGFSVLDDQWDLDEEQQYIRTLKRVKLYEVSPVTWPAYPQTSAEVRALDALGDKPEMPRREVDMAVFAARRRRLELAAKS